MNKLISKLVVGCLAFGVAVSVFAQLQPATRTQSALGALVRDVSIVEEQSNIPDQSSRVGYLIARYDVATDGGAQGAYQIGPELPVGMLVVGGYAQVVTGFATNTTRVALSVQTANDLLSATDVSSPGVHRLAPSDKSFVVPITPDGDTVTTLASPIQIATTPKRVTVTVSEADATSGTLFVYLELMYLQPPAE